MRRFDPYVLFVVVIAALFLIVGYQLGLWLTERFPL